MSRFCPEGKVIGIEADAKVATIANDNVFINGFQGIAKVLNAAAGRSSEPVTLHRRIGRSGNTSIARMPDDFLRTMAEPASEAFVVDGVRVDDLVTGEMGGRVDFLKIDVEGGGAPCY